MLGTLGKRAIDLAVLFFALYAFAFVPLGKRSAFDHLRAIFSTPPAKTAGEELGEGAGRLKRKLLGEPESPRRRSGAPTNAHLAPADRPDASL